MAVVLSVVLALGSGVAAPGSGALAATRHGAAPAPRQGADSGLPHGLPHDPQDDILAGIGVDERPGSRVPADIPLVDLSGRTVRLGDYLGGGPVILSLNYYTCPMLCPLTFRNLARTMEEVKGLSLSSDYRVVTVSFNPEEQPGIARAKADETHRFLPELADPDRRWPFLRASADSIRRLTESVGYRYRKVGADYAHPNVVIILTPDGMISRYLYGLEVPSMDLKLALIEAADGKIGASSVANSILMYCFEYDPVGKKYALVARNVMKAAGVATLGFLGVLFGWLWIRRGRTRASGETGK